MDLFPTDFHLVHSYCRMLFARYLRKEHCFVSRYPIRIVVVETMKCRCSTDPQYQIVVAVTRTDAPNHNSNYTWRSILATQSTVVHNSVDY